MDMKLLMGRARRLLVAAKINIGLKVINQRDDGYHNIQSVFYPVFNCNDILEINYSKGYS